MSPTSPTDPCCRLEADPEGQVLHLRGDWTLARLVELQAGLATLNIDPLQPPRLDGSGLRMLDSAGANHLISHLDRLGIPFPHLRLAGFSAQGLALLRLVAGRRGVAIPASRRRGRRGLNQVVGWHALAIARGTRAGLAFIGQTGQAIGHLLRHPGLMRWREFFVQLEMVGLRAIPIVMLMSYLIGVVFAYLLGIQMQKFSANHLVVDGVGIGIAREMAPLITAVLMAGRSGAAFTAHLGAMKVSQEIDAIVTLGLSPFQVLVLPRLFAIVLMLPLLTFVADVAGIIGAAHVAAWNLGIPAVNFYDRLQDVLPLNTVLFGLSKTPVFAAAIALIACHSGFTVRRDARSVGLHTTSTVVRSIVAVILINAVFAVAYPEIGP
ncbi:MAG: ABC transporter permease [Pseudomonadota bacterium]|nr:ABC transporter permease [Pseudomonadota bacterium]